MGNQPSKPEPNESMDWEAVAKKLLENEAKKKKASRRNARRRRRERLAEARRSVERMHRSIEVIKWCIIGICSVWVLSFIISLFVLIQVQSRVREIDGQVQKIRSVIENPFSSAGSRLGGQLDAKFRDFLNPSDPPAED